jgi:hypothetical protein
VLNHFGTLLSVCARVILAVLTYLIIVNTYLLSVLPCYAYRVVVVKSVVGYFIVIGVT